MVEVAGVLFANSILQHNAYGFAGGILAVLGIIAINQGRRKPRTARAHHARKKAVSNLRR